MTCGFDWRAFHSANCFTVRTSTGGIYSRVTGKLLLLLAARATGTYSALFGDLSSLTPKQMAPLHMTCRTTKMIRTSE